MSVRSLNGLRPTPDDHEAVAAPRRDAVALAARVRGVSAPPPAVDLRHLVVEVLDQGSTSSCGAHAVAQAIRMLARARGVASPPLPSRRYLYRDAVGYGHTHFGYPIADDGTTFGDLFAGTRWVGIVDEAEWPWSEWDVLASPPMSIYRAGSDRRWTLNGYTQLRPTSLADDLRKALSLSHPCVVGITIDQAFEDPNGPSLITSLGPSVGGHAMAVAGYDPDGIWLCNSWSSGYREQGFVKLAWDIVASERVMDAWTLNIEPPRSAP